MLLVTCIITDVCVGLLQASVTRTSCQWVSLRCCIYARHCTPYKCTRVSPTYVIARLGSVHYNARRFVALDYTSLHFNCNKLHFSWPDRAVRNWNKRQTSCCREWLFKPLVALSVTNVFGNRVFVLNGDSILYSTQISPRPSPLDWRIKLWSAGDTPVTPHPAAPCFTSVPCRALSSKRCSAKPSSVARNSPLATYSIV